MASLQIKNAPLMYIILSDERYGACVGFYVRYTVAERKYHFFHETATGTEGIFHHRTSRLMENSIAVDICCLRRTLISSMSPGCRRLAIGGILLPVVICFLAQYQFHSPVLIAEQM